ncbi:MAG: pyridoxamine 5'-phosphate oxidase family protein [Dehalococcoidia bacterium]
MPDNKYTTFSEQDIESFKPEMKVGLLATVNADGLPHLTLISTLQASSPTELFWGQFSEGMSKANIQKNPKAGFMIMTLDRNLWRGTARFTHTAKTGAEFDLLNNTPMFRYNAYFGIHTVYYMDLVEHLGKEPLPMGDIIQAAIKTMVAKTLAGKGSGREVLNPFTHKLIGKIDNLKFLAYIDGDGYPVIIPVIQAQTAGTDRVIFASSVYADDLRAIPKDASCAIFCMSFDMQTVLLRGMFTGIRSIGGIKCGEIEVNWIYSPMPPKMEQVYPPMKLEKITSF